MFFVYEGCKRGQTAPSPTPKRWRPNGAETANYGAKLGHGRLNTKEKRKIVSRNEGTRPKFFVSRFRKHGKRRQTTRFRCTPDHGEKNKLRSSVDSGDFRAWIFALRAVFNGNVRQLAVNECPCFLCGLWYAMSVNGFATA